jgi:hypothetical protein
VNQKNGRTNESISHRPFESSIKTLLKIMDSIASNLNFQNAKQEIGCLVLILQQIKQNHSTAGEINNDVIPKKIFKSNHRRRIAPSDPSLIKPSGQIQAVHPDKPKRSKAFINPNISLNHEPKG